MKQLKFLTTIFCILGAYLVMAFAPYSMSHLRADVGTSIDALKSKPNFGKTHFIVGYDDYDLEMDDSESATRTEDDLPDETTTETPIVLDKNGKLCAAFFAPDHNLRAALRYLIKNEKERISIAVFAFTDSHLARELVAAHKRGVKIELMTDPSCLRSQHQKIDMLAQAGIPIYVYKSEFGKGPSSIMHNKFALFEKTIHDKTILWTGSFNFTKSGSDFNQENVLVLDDARIIKQYADQFERLRDRTGKLRAAPKIAFNKKGFITTIPS